MGYLYGLDIKYFVEVNFDGFQKLVDMMGGVTVNVQIPVSDDRFPSINGSMRRVYIPSGIQHMTGVGGASLRPLAPRLERLRPWCAAAAAPAVHA